MKHTFYWRILFSTMSTAKQMISKTLCLKSVYKNQVLLSRGHTRCLVTHPTPSPLPKTEWMQNQRFHCNAKKEKHKFCHSLKYSEHKWRHFVLFLPQLNLFSNKASVSSQSYDTITQMINSTVLIMQKQKPIFYKDLLKYPFSLVSFTLVKFPPFLDIDIEFLQIW